MVKPAPRFAGLATRFAWLIVLALACAPMASATDYFVATNGSDAAAGTSWATALLTISNAVAKTASDDTVTVSNGTYNITNQISITNGITVQSLNGATNAIVNGGGSVRCFYVSHTNAVVDGFTITNGYLASGNGGGVYLNGGTVQNCVIRNCYAGTYAGGAYINQNSTIKNSTITANSCIYQGAGVYLNGGGLVRNCLITRNSGRGPGGIWFQGAGGTVESCTISRNSGSSTAGGSPGGGVGGSGGTIKNTIIYFNTASPGGWGDNWGGSGITYSYVCTTPAVGGTSNTTADPLFVNYTNDNYRLRPGSAAIDTGQSNAWMAGAQDLDGNARIISNTVDIGAYEFAVSNLMCGFAANTTEGFDPHTVVFTGYASGTNLNGLGYQWDVDNNGSFEYQGSAVVTNTYTSGLYAVALTVTNADGETNTWIRENYIRVGPATTYVDVASASPAFPYASWATAATSINASVNAGVTGTLVLVTNGTYQLTSAVTIAKGRYVTVRSVNGPGATIVDGGGAVRGFSISATNAVVDGFTIRNCNASGGGGVYLNGVGLAQNCVIISNNGSAGNYGGGAYMDSGGTLRNCLIMGNTAGLNGGVYLAYSGGLVDNCTIVSNRATTAGAWTGGVFGGTVRNSIVYFNFNSASGTYTNWVSVAFTYTCTTPAAGGAGNLTNDPAFVNAPANYRLRQESPCVNVGTNQTWMAGATDLDGRDRIIRSIVDLGAYEWTPPRGTVMKFF